MGSAGPPYQRIELNTVAKLGSFVGAEQGAYAPGEFEVGGGDDSSDDCTRVHRASLSDSFRRLTSVVTAIYLAAQPQLPSQAEVTIGSVAQARR